MVPVPDPAAPVFCIDAWEARVTGGRGSPDQGKIWPDTDTTGSANTGPGVVPATGITWYQAAGACTRAGKHLCTVAEWTDACDGAIGPGGSTFPWGETPDPVERCVTQTAGGPARVREVQLTGSMPDCHGPLGVHDLIGNAWEWADAQVQRPDGSPVAAKVGAAFYSGRPPLTGGGAPSSGGPTPPATVSPDQIRGDHGRCAADPALEHPPAFSGSIGFRCCQPPEPP